MIRTWLAAETPARGTTGKMNRVTTLLVSLLLLTTGAFAANLATSPLAGAKGYPNPWRIDRHANVSITFDGMPGGTHIKIFTIAGHLVKELTTDSSGRASWDRTNSSGHSVASGVYIYLLIDPQGNDASGKLAIIK